MIVKGKIPKYNSIGPAFKSDARCPVADRLHDHELMLFENCAYSPTDEQIDQIGQAFRKVMRC